MKQSIRLSAQRHRALHLVGIGLAAILLLAAPRQALAELALVMVEAPGCSYCVQWHEEVGVEYPLTAEGRAAPLRRIGLRETLPDDLDLASRPVFTPTFILVQSGVEISRVEGYPGEDFFWFLLGRMLDETDTNWMDAHQSTN
jgi:hypothetical protein